MAAGERGGGMFNLLKCKFGLHKLVPLDLGDMDYKDEIHGWIGYLSNKRVTVLGNIYKNPELLEVLND